jgi:hypothetical protein
LLGRGGRLDGIAGKR